MNNSVPPIPVADCGWPCQSFSEHSVAWILIFTLVSGILGGVIGASIKFLFEDILSAGFTARRESRKILNLYTVPLCRAAETLESRINNIVRLGASPDLFDDEYYRLSTIYIFAAFWGWAQIVEGNFRHIGFGNTRKSRALESGLRDVMGAFASTRRYFPWHRDQTKVAESALYQLVIDATGDALVVPRNGAEPETVIGFGEFVRRCESDAKMSRWVDLVEAFLRRVNEPLVHDRLIIAGAQLNTLIGSLEPRHHYVGKHDPRNLDRLKHSEIADLMRR